MTGKSWKGIGNREEDCMTEKEMEDLLWDHPDKFFDQQMSKF